MSTQPRVGRQAVSTHSVDVIAHRHEWMKMFLVRPHWSEQFCKSLGFRAGFHGIQKRQRITATSRFGKQTDFQCAQSIRSAPYHLIIVSPADSLVPAAIRKFGAAVDVEGERHAERPGDDLALGDADESIVEVQIEYWWRKIEVRRRVMSHELWPNRF